MAKGSEIIVSSEPRGVFKEGTISGTPVPGTIMELDPTAATPVGGEFQWRVYQPGTDGNRKMIAVLLPDRLQGKLATDAYVTGTRGFLYVPVAGEQLNVLIKAATNPAFGDTMQVETGTGKVKATSGTPQSQPFQMLEALTNAADQLGWVQYTGY